MLGTMLPMSLLRAGALVLVASAANSPHWSYAGADGPTHWASLSPEFHVCATGQFQSPIDIHDAATAQLPPLEVHYAPIPLHARNDGHTIRVDVPEGSRLVVGGHTYRLMQFHFHAPSEEAVDGKRHALVAHLVHQDADGHLAVIAVLFDPGSINETLRGLFDNLPADVGSESAVPGATLEPVGLLPPARGYYEYEGSLTTPPCSEGVSWYVMKNVMAVSDRQLAMFRMIYPDNARPLQPTHGRAIRQSMP
jgi:carbonic anhydrase